MGGGTSKEEDLGRDTPVIIQDYLSKKKEVVKKVVDFMKYVDCLQASAEHFARQITRNNDHDERRARETEHSAMYLLCTSKASLEGQKRYVIKEIARLNEFISKVIAERSEHVNDPPTTCKDLWNCIDDSNQTLDISDVDFEQWSITTFKYDIIIKEAQIENLVRENGNLREETCAFKKMIEKHDDEMAKEETFHRKQIEKSNDRHRKELKQMSEDHNKALNQMSEDHNKALQQMSEDHNKALKQMSDDHNEASYKTNDAHKQKLEYIKDLKESISTLNIEKRVLEDKIQDEKNENCQLREKISECEKTSEATVSELEKTIVKLREDGNQKDEMLFDLEKQSKDANAIITNLQKSEGTNRTKVNELEVLKNQKEEKLKKLKIQNEGIRAEVQAKKEECNNLVVELQDLRMKSKKEIKEKQEECEILKGDLKRTKSSLGAAKAELQDFRSKSEKDVQKKTDECENLKADLVQLRSSLAVAKAELQDFRSKSEKDVQKKTDECENLKADLVQLRSSLAVAKAELQDFRSKSEKDVQKKTDECENLKADLVQLRSSLAVAEAELQDFRRKLEKHIREKTDECENLKADLVQLRSSLAVAKAELQDFRSKSEKDVQKKTDECENLKADLVQLRSSLAVAKAELQDFRRKSIIKVKLFCQRRVNIMSDFENELMALLKSKIDEEHKELIFEQCAVPKDTDTDTDSDTDPTIVLCLSASRIGTDAINAVHGLHLSPKKALLMIHHKDVHALPQQSSERVLTGEDFKMLGCISDMAFLSGKGIFQCEINTNSIIKLTSFIRKEGAEQRKY